jgi:hypothetical protein
MSVQQVPIPADAPYWLREDVKRALEQEKKDGSL